MDFIAVSFVKSADVIHNLKSYISARAERKIEVIAKLESFDSVPNVQGIVEAADAVMVARGDLGTFSVFCTAGVPASCFSVTQIAQDRGHCQAGEF